MANYRKIYEEHYECSLLPYIEIHHIDGNHNNDGIDNLMAVTTEEHYDIHISQKDYSAALMIASRLDISQEQRFWLNKEQATQNNKIGKVGFSLGHASRAGKLGGIKGGKYAKENKIGIHSISKEAEYRRQLNSKTTKAIRAGKASLILMRG